MKSARIVSAVVCLMAVLLAPVEAQAQRSCAYFEFNKGAGSNANVSSDLIWRYVNEFGQCILSHTFRAGSGDNQDPCHINHGWLPNGWYDLGNEGHIHNRDGTLIDGMVWDLQNMMCQGNGNLRTELFIHTEETSSNTNNQGDCSPLGGDQPRCWDRTKAFTGAQWGTNDYYSEGCIKVRRDSWEENPGQGISWAHDVNAIHTDWHNLGGGSGHGVSRTDSLHVVS